MAWYSQDWLYRKKITIDQTKIDADLSDFTTLVKLGDANFDFSKAESDEVDILFTDADGETELDFERAVPHSSVNLATGLVSHWGLNDNAANTTVVDAVGAHNGTANKNTSGLTTATAKVGTAFDLDGTNDYVDCSNHADFNFGTASTFSLCAWIKTTKTSGVIFSRRDVNQAYKGYSLGIDGTTQKLVWFIIDTNPTKRNYVLGNTVLNDDGWHFVVATYDGTNTIAGMKVYVDGIEEREVADAVGAMSSIDSGKSLLIGAQWNDVTVVPSFDGIIDSPRVYNTVLTPEAIQALYNLGSGTESITTANSLAVYHVKVPAVDDAVNTDFYMYYGNAAASDLSSPADAWDSYTKEVYHLNDNAASTTVVDSVSGNNGTNQANTNTKSVLGGSSRALNFNGTSDYVNVTSEVIPDNSDEFTAEAIFSLAGGAGTRRFILETEPNYAISIGVQTDNTIECYAQQTTGNTTKRTTATPTIGKRYHVMLVFKRNDYLRIYLNGAEDVNQASGNYATEVTSGLHIGTYRSADARWGYGKIAEVKIANTARSAAWVKAEYNSLFNTLVSYSAEEEGSFVISDETLTLSEDSSVEVISNTARTYETATLTEEVDISAFKSSSHSESLALSEEFESLLELVPKDTLTLSDSLEIGIYESYDLDNDFHLAIPVLSDYTNYINTAKEVIKNIFNKFRFFIQVLGDTANTLATKKAVVHDLTNKFRMILSWQRAADAGFQSLGKEEIYVYIDDVDQTDVNIDSISIVKTANSAHTASFVLAREYDAVSKPSTDSVVEIYYNDWLLYKGYIVTLNPSSNPEGISVVCKDDYWYNDRESLLFNVGHSPQLFELSSEVVKTYYTTITQGLSACGFSTDIGNFIPDLMSINAGRSSAITNLITECGNFGWFYDVNGYGKLIRYGEGDIVILDRQELGENLSLLHVLRHKISESIENIVNQYRVYTGVNSIVFWFKKTGGGNNYLPYKGDQTPPNEVQAPEVEEIEFSCNPKWGSEPGNELSLETLQGVAVKTSSGSGYDKHREADGWKFKNVFSRYEIVNLNNYLPPKPEEYTQEEWDAELAGQEYRYEEAEAPEIQIEYSAGDPASIKNPSSINYPAEGSWQRADNDTLTSRITSGFSIDYQNGTLTLAQPTYTLELDEKNGEATKYSTVNVTVYLKMRKIYKPATDDENTDEYGNPAPPSLPTDEDGEYDVEDLSYDYNYAQCFLSQKVGSYSTTVIRDLLLSGYGIQYGFAYYSRGELRYRQPYNDLPYVVDLTKWKLSQTAYPKINGEVTVTLDALCYYNIDLTKRVYIDNITDTPLNIVDITYNMAAFTVTLKLEYFAPFTRTVSLPWHGD
jgi:hypothetical protein